MSEYIEEVDDGNFEQLVLQSNRPVLVDFWALWCGPCRMLAPIVESLAKQYAGNAQVVKLNVDDNRQVAGRFQIQSIPTMLIFKNGQLVDRIIGAQPKQAIAARLTKAGQA